MRVLCINNGKIYNPYIKQMLTAPELIEGDVYRVIEEKDSSYVLSEVAHDPSFEGFSKKRFVPLTGDETEVLEEVKKGGGMRIAEGKDVRIGICDVDKILS